MLNANAQLIFLVVAEEAML